MYEFEVDILPGHGGFDPGAVCENIRESDGNLSVALKLSYLLNLNNIKTNLSRTIDVACGNAKNIKDDINNQIKFSNSSNADIAISIHFNSSINSSANGIEVLYTNYSNKNDNEIKLAQLVLDELINDTGMTNRGIKEISSGIGVIKHIKKPCILSENGFISNNNDRIWCSSEEHHWILAKSHAKAICKYFNIKYKEEDEILLKSWQKEMGESAVDKLIEYGILSDISWKEEESLGNGLPGWLQFELFKRIYEKLKGENN